MTTASKKKGAKAYTVDLLARIVFPYGQQNFSEIKAILEKNSAFVAKFAKYQSDLEDFITALYDPKTKITAHLVELCAALDKQQEHLINISPDERITSYLIVQGHFLAEPHENDPNFKRQMGERHKLMPVIRATKYIFPQGDKRFEEVADAFKKNIFYTGEFNGYEEAFELMRNEILRKQKRVDEKRCRLFDELKAELISLAPHPLIKAHIEAKHKIFKELNHRVP